jgi:hypothetical protein
LLAGNDSLGQDELGRENKHLLDQSEFLQVRRPL